MCDNQLALLFKQLAHDESLIEHARQQLCQLNQFTPYQAFNALDPSGSQ
jgi:hypothetical protein